MTTTKKKNASKKLRLKKLMLKLHKNKLRHTFRSFKTKKRQKMSP